MPRVVHRAAVLGQQCGVLAQAEPRPVPHRLPGVLRLRAAHAVQQTVHGEAPLRTLAVGPTGPMAGMGPPEGEDMPLVLLSCFQYDWYTKKTSVVVDVVKREGEGERVRSLRSCDEAVCETGALVGTT